MRNDPSLYEEKLNYILSIIHTQFISTNNSVDNKLIQ